MGRASSKSGQSNSCISYFCTVGDIPTAWKLRFLYTPQTPLYPGKRARAHSTQAEALKEGGSTVGKGCGLGETPESRVNIPGGLHLALGTEVPPDLSRGLSKQVRIRK